MASAIGVAGAVLALGLANGGAALGQTSILIADDNGDRIMIATDVSGDGEIDASDPLELHVYFDGTNAMGFTGPGNPNGLGFFNGLALIGDQNATVGRRWMWARDLNGDGDALDDGESGVFADVSNAGGFSFASPSGVAFTVDGRPALVNVSNAAGFDDIFLATVSDGDGDAQDAGELSRWVTVNAFGTAGPYGPQEACFANDGTLYLRNSSPNLHGVYRLGDSDGSGQIDSASEFTVFFDSTNGSGLAVTAGFSMNVDPVRARSFYTWQLASGSNDQLLRLSDLNSDGDAQDAGEATVVYQTNEGGFTAVDAAPLADGSVVISDNSGNRLFRLIDLDGDGLFIGEGERVLVLGSGLSAARALALVRDVGCGAADLGRAGGLIGGDNQLDNNDFIAFISHFFNQAPLSDVGRQGGVGPGDGLFDNNDFIVFIDQFFAGCT